MQTIKKILSGYKLSEKVCTNRRNSNEGIESVRTVQYHAYYLTYV